MILYCVSPSPNAYAQRNMDNAFITTYKVHYV